MTESTLVSAQLAYVYPRVAQLADLRGDRAFAARLRTAGAQALATTRREWTGRGWYSRGYATERQIGTGAIFGEPQPWALLAGARIRLRRARWSPTSVASSRASARRRRCTGPRRSAPRSRRRPATRR
jgi:cellobiose phosphorylase